MKTFKVYHEEYLGDDHKEIKAFDHEQAAEEYAEYYDSGDYTLMSGNTIKVRVVDEDGVSQELVCYGESVPQYYAREVKDAKDKKKSQI